MWVPETPGDSSRSSRFDSGNSSEGIALPQERENTGEQEDTTIGNDKEQPASGESNHDSDIPMKNTFADTGMKCESQNVSEEVAPCSSSDRNCTSENGAIEYRNYGVFIVNDSSKTTASRASIVGNMTFVVSFLLAFCMNELLELLSLSSYFVQSLVFFANDLMRSHVL